MNGILVKTSTTQSDNGLPWLIVSKTTSVYCKVTYKKDDGTLSAPSTSTTFTPNVRDLNFPQTISTSTPPPNFGCTTGTVSYSLNTFTCTGNFCDPIYTVGAYNITWQAPAGWVQTSLTNNGSDVSFTPDATSTGTLTATIHLPCGYTDTRTFTITRGTSAPTFTTPSVQACSSSATMSINPTCGASNYTYSIIGNPGVTFTSNGQQILTTASTTVSFSITAVGSSVNTINAKANYPNSISSTNAGAKLITGVPYVYSTYNYNGSQNPIHLWQSDQYYNPVCNLASTKITTAIQGATSFTWTKVTSNPSNITWTTNDGNNLDFYFWNVGQIAVFKIDASNTCGTTTQQYGFKSVTCGGGGCLSYAISPNPTQGTLNVVVPNIPAPCYLTNSSISATTSNIGIVELKVYDQSGNLKAQKKYTKSKQATLDISLLKAGVYFVDISDGTKTERQQVIINN